MQIIGLPGLSTLLIGAQLAAPGNPLLQQARDESLLTLGLCLIEVNGSTNEL